MISPVLAPPQPFSINSIINGDCLNVLSHIRDNSIDMTVFSPPYDAIRDYKNEWQLDPSALGKELHRVTKDGGLCAVVIGDGR